MMILLLFYALIGPFDFVKCNVDVGMDGINAAVDVHSTLLTEVEDLPAFQLESL
jgi:hypothetical protein